MKNPVRLRCLRAVVRQPDLSVSRLAKDLDLPVPVASQYLRDLQARGVLAVSRRSRWVFYRAEHDRSVRHAAALLAAVSAAVDDRASTLNAARRLLDGLSHPRRLSILRHLVLERRAGLAALRRATAISQPALQRHLARLERDGWVRHDEPRWALAGDLPLLARRLLAELRA